MVARISPIIATAAAAFSLEPVTTASSVSLITCTCAPDSSFMRRMFTPWGPTTSPPRRYTETRSTTLSALAANPFTGVPAASHTLYTSALAAATFCWSVPPIVHVPSPFWTLTEHPVLASRSRMTHPPAPMTRPSLRSPI